VPAHVSVPAMDGGKMIEKGAIKVEEDGAETR
jgi:hypothetical protein